MNFQATQPFTSSWRQGFVTSPRPTYDSLFLTLKLITIVHLTSKVSVFPFVKLAVPSDALGSTSVLFNPILSFLWLVFVDPLSFTHLVIFVWIIVPTFIFVIRFPIIFFVNRLLLFAPFPVGVFILNLLFIWVVILSFLFRALSQFLVFIEVLFFLTLFAPFIKYRFLGTFSSFRTWKTYFQILKTLS